ncbi:MAG: PhnA domain-containing protein [Bacteriovorax sp.]|nr:PhnA domain-containing protein [Bacteriovorax sp.]
MNLESTLLKRCNSKCELCSSSASLTVYNVPPVTEVSADNSIMICDTCRKKVSDPSSDVNHWRCLNESMWSEFPAVLVMAWRILNKLSTNDWARDLLDQLFLDEETLKFAEALKSDDGDVDNVKSTKDSNGTILIEGDSVTLIKDLEVKGANFTAKRGTLVKNISLTSNPEQIEGRVNGTLIVLLTCFLKKAI